MANEQITKYIETVQAQGYNDATIRDVLSKNGWQLQDIDDAFQYVRLSKASLSAQAPVAPGAASAVSINDNKEKIISTIFDKNTQVKASDNSPFASGLAVVLVCAMMILLNKIIDDASFYTNTINSQLVFDTMIVIPFLLAAFIIHESYSSYGKRYLLMSQPYFVVSAALLVRLLWDTSKYILNTSATYGVYIVLVMIILVLTGSILFVQKYIKS